MRRSGVEILPAVGLAALFLAMAGGADNVSSVFRNTILQAASPDGMRGRLQGIFIVVVTGGPRLGDLYAGLVVAAGISVPAGHRRRADHRPRRAAPAHGPVVPPLRRPAPPRQLTGRSWCA
ncbi:hypothetical protein Q9Q99_19245 [Curtobacterium flaccumfaciens]|nr:hypothetical protein Q9Q99_19245 [Curtobacterium flaccumfaciens]